MRRETLTLAFLASMLLLMACGAETPPPPPAPPHLLRGESEDNVVALVNGAVVVHRTGEAGLDASAIRAIDSDPESVWATPPGDLDETMTVALRAPATIRRIGFSAGTVKSGALAAGLRFEASMDGVSFQVLGSVELDGDRERWLDLTPVRAAFLRVTTLPPTALGAQVALVPTILASGDPDDSTQPSIDGTWTVNEMTVVLHSAGPVVLGASDEATTRGIDGGWDRGLVRFIFSRGNEVGVGIIAVGAGGQHLNGMIWYRNPGAPHFGTTWFGERSGAPRARADVPDVMDAWLRNEGRSPLFGLSFDGERLVAGSAPVVDRLATLLRANPPGLFRFRAHEVGNGTLEEDLRLAEAKLESLRQALRSAGVDPARAEFVAGGRSEALREPDTPWTALQERLNNRIDLELARVVPR